MTEKTKVNPKISAMPNQIAASPEDGLWESLPDHILLEVFYFLKAHALLQAAQVCSQWRRVAHDEFLWKDLICEKWNIERSLSLAPDRKLWCEEYKRLHYHTPCYQTEVLTKHRDQVLHVSFSHDGKHFATSSKDGFVKVWSSSHPCTLVHSVDMRVFTWKYTQFTQFNKSDSLLLVSGVHFGSHSTSGEIVVFNMRENFKLECRVQNKPYDIFGTWYNESHLLSGNLHWLGNFTSCSVLWLNKAYQDVGSERENVVMRLFKFQNVNASSIRTILMADCLDSGQFQQDSADSLTTGQSQQDTAKSLDIGHSTPDHTDNGATQGQAGHLDRAVCGQQSHNTSAQTGDHTKTESLETRQGQGVTVVTVQQTRANIDSTGGALFGSHEGQTASHADRSSKAHSNGFGGVNTMGVQGNTSHQKLGLSGSDVRLEGGGGCAKITGEAGVGCDGQAVAGRSSASSGSGEYKEPDKYLIFTTGSLTYTPHQIGIKRVRHEDALGKMQKLTMERERQQAQLSAKRVGAGGDSDSDEGPAHSNGHVLMDMEQQPPNQVQEEDAMRMDPVDHLIEMGGHIIGFCLSEDSRYLYVNTRAWPQNYQISEALEPPPIAQEIEIHVIDLVTIRDLGVMHTAHKAFTPNDECFFIFLDVCKQYVASGAEDKHAYLWDRHYRSLVRSFDHDDVVNSVAFHPTDPETLVTVSDDNMVKVWRSRNRCQELGGKWGAKVEEGGKEEGQEIAGTQSNDNTTNTGT